MNVVRYYPQFARAFPIFRQLTCDQCPLTDDMREAIANASDCAEVYAVMKRDFWCAQRVLAQFIAQSFDVI